MNIKKVKEKIMNKFNHNKGDICGIKKCCKATIQAWQANVITIN